MAVYFAQIEGRTEVKIGHADQLHMRLRNIQTYHPVGVTFIRTFIGTRSDEKALHYRFAHLRITGEWFAWNDAFLGDLGLPDLGPLGPSLISIRRLPHTAEHRAKIKAASIAFWAERRRELGPQGRAA